MNGIPAYVDEMAEDAVKRLKNLQYGDTASFAFVTDIHNCSDYAQRALYAIEKINKEIPIGFTCLGGDYLCNNARTSKENAIFQHKELVDIISKYGQNPLAVVAVGNHDYNVFGSDENAVMPDELFDILMTHHSDVMYDKENPKGLYGYYDDKKAKLRMIFLNLMDMPGKNKAVNHSAAAIGTAQLKWLVNCGLNLPDSEWGVVFFSHYEPIPHPFTGATRVFGGEALWGVICAFKNGTAFSASAKRGEMQYYVDCDFTKQGKRDVIGYFYGHHHCDLQWSEAGIPLISCLAAASDNFSGGMPLFENGMYPKTRGSGEESAFSVFTVNRNERRVYCIRCGAGPDYSVGY